jgi:hypothetical protein
LDTWASIVQAAHVVADLDAGLIEIRKAPEAVLVGAADHHQLSIAQIWLGERRDPRARQRAAQP